MKNSVFLFALLLAITNSFTVKAKTEWQVKIIVSPNHADWVAQLKAN